LPEQVSQKASYVTGRVIIWTVVRAIYSLPPSP
jgi:hypothetical protein